MRPLNLATFVLLSLALVAGSGCEQKPAAPTNTTSSSSPSPRATAATPVHGDVSSFTELRVECESSRARLVQNQSGAWQVVEPFPSIADAPTVRVMLETIAAQSFATVLHSTADAKTLSQLGLAPPQLVVEATGDQGVLRIVGGLENGFDGSIPVQRNADPAIYRLDGAFRVSLCRSADSLRAKNLLSVEENTIEELVLKRKSTSLRIQRGSDKQWHLGEGTHALAEKAVVAGLLASLRRAKALEFFEDTTLETTRFGLSSPAVQMRLNFRDGNFVEYTVSDALKADPRRIAIRRRDSGTASTSLAVFEKASLPLLFEPFTSFADQALLKFDSKRVNRLIVQTDSGPALVLERNVTDAGTTGWQVVAPSRGPAQQFKVAALLFALSSLRSAKPGPTQRLHPSEKRPKPSVTFSLFVENQRVAELSVEQHRSPDNGWLTVQTPEGRYQIDHSVRSALATDLAAPTSDAGP
jgi:Domain of unknown function (DUF4340)